MCLESQHTILRTERPLRYGSEDTWTAGSRSLGPALGNVKSGGQTKFDSSQGSTYVQALVP